MALIDDCLDLAARPREGLPARALAMARLSLVDWIVCGRAALAEPITPKMRAFAEAEGGRPVAALLGGGRAPARMAALVNGTVSHVLDLDDTHLAHIGHLSVAVYPAALAVGEEAGASADAVVEAFLVGAECAVRIGVTLGPAHYDRGFHQTATAGAFGATVAAGRLMGLSREEMRAALGLCASRASGLKSLFGTMGKPYNAGQAAANGVEVARLARLGLTAGEDGLGGPMGFLATHSDAPAPPPAMDRFLFEDNTYKFHACCHGLHAMIESLTERPDGLGPADISAVEVRSHPLWLRVCDIKAPRNGPEAKFSFALVAAMVCHDLPTGRDASYTEAAADPAFHAFAERVTVVADETLGDGASVVTLTPHGGEPVVRTHDVKAPQPPATLEARLAEKAHTLIGAEGDAIAARLADLTGLGAADVGALLGGPASPRRAVA